MKLQNMKSILIHFSLFIFFAYAFNFQKEVLLVSKMNGRRIECAACKSKAVLISHPQWCLDVGERKKYEHGVLQYPMVQQHFLCWKTKKTKSPNEGFLRRPRPKEADFEADFFLKQLCFYEIWQFSNQKCPDIFEIVKLCRMKSYLRISYNAGSMVLYSAVLYSLYSGNK